MRSKFSLILPALVLLNLLVKGTSMYRNRTPWFVMPGYMDLVMFYNTSQPIWTVMSTDTSNLTCQADKMYNITYEYVVFERFYKIYENISDFYLLGRFTNWNTQPDRWPNSRRPRYDQMVLSYLGMWLELRAWNFTVSGISILCTTYFYQHQRHKERTVYTPDCQHILEPVMNRSVSSWRRRRSAT
uniref:Lipocalin n=1 Tax=Rhipicephalus appendiculatus TaxID=34631 RepID=A0A131YP70_RHIAP